MGREPQLDDALPAHLIAPYAKIIISATPADTQETDDAASQVAMPEIMEGVEVIAAAAPRSPPPRPPQRSQCLPANHSPAHARPRAGRFQRPA